LAVTQAKVAASSGSRFVSALLIMVAAAGAVGIRPTQLSGHDPPWQASPPTWLAFAAKIVQLIARVTLPAMTRSGSDYGHGR